MATEQLPAAVYSLAGQVTVTGWEVISNVYGFEEDAEDKADSAGQHKAKITYSRRQTLSVELEALAAANQDAYTKGGEVTSGVFPLVDGSTTTAWTINSAPLSRTRGVPGVSLDLIQQGDLLA